jgi:hypothetical protein
MIAMPHPNDEHNRQPPDPDGQRATPDRVLSPGGRLARIVMATAAVSLVAPVGIALSLNSVGGRLFPVPYGGFAYIECCGIPAELVVIVLAMIVVRGRRNDVFTIIPVGAMLAIMYVLLGFKAVQFAGGLVGTSVYLVVGGAGTVIGFLLPAIATESRFPTRLRLGVPFAVLAATAGIWVTVYLVRYGT